MPLYVAPSVSICDRCCQIFQGYWVFLCVLMGVLAAIALTRWLIGKKATEDIRG